MTEDVEYIYVGDKKIQRYLSACFFAFSHDKPHLHLIGRGNNIKRAIDIAAILCRQHLDIPEKLPTLSELKEALDKNNVDDAKRLVNQMMACEVLIGSEKFENRNISTIDIIIRGKRKNAESISK